MDVTSRGLFQRPVFVDALQRFEVALVLPRTSPGDENEPDHFPTKEEPLRAILEPDALTTEIDAPFAPLAGLPLEDALPRVASRGPHGLDQVVDAWLRGVGLPAGNPNQKENEE